MVRYFMMFTTFLVFLINASVCGFLFDDRLVKVRTAVGEFVGIKSALDINGTRKHLHTFLGIPYAEAPTEARRFREPVPKAKFEAPFEALNYGPACLQYGGGQPSSHNITFSEDCLSLNIFAPGNLPNNGERFPVMMFIHGGGFLTGYSTRTEGGYLSLSGDVIVVTANYRLNVFGFLSTGDKAAPGNYGLWDQQLAIKWVHDNIESFGGDRNRVTIFGQSAGGGSVTFQTIYPGNKGLVHRAVAESGTFAGPWAFNKLEDVRNFTRQFADAAGCLQDNSDEMVKCLQFKPAAIIKSVMDGPLGDEGCMWKPVIDNKFLFSEPLDLLTRNFPSIQVEDTFLGIDMIIGVNSKEGFSDFPFLNETSKPDFSKSDIDNKLIPETIHQCPYNTKNLPSSVTVATVIEYTDWEHLDDFKSQISRFVDFISDYWFNVGAALTAKKHSSYSSNNTYVYKLATAPPRHLLPVYNGSDGPTVVNHADDLIYVFGPWFDDGLKIHNGMSQEMSKIQRNIGKAMLTMWTNFAKSGDPNSPVDVKEYINTEWTQYDPTFQEYLEITPHSSMRSMFANRAVEFWTELVPSLTKAANDAD